MWGLFQEHTQVKAKSLAAALCSPDSQAMRAPAVGRLPLPSGGEPTAAGPSLGGAACPPTQALSPRLGSFGATGRAQQPLAGSGQQTHNRTGAQGVSKACPALDPFQPCPVASQELPERRFHEHGVESEGEDQFLLDLALRSRDKPGDANTNGV